MRIIERNAEHYDVHEMPVGRDYRWFPERVVLECSKCGKRMSHTSSEILSSEVIECECGKGNTARIREELVIELVDEEYAAHHHPWFYEVQEQSKQHLRDEAAYPEESAWRYNDITSANIKRET